MKKKCVKSIWSVACTIKILRLSFDNHHEWHLYYKFIQALCIVVNYDRICDATILSTLTDDSRVIIHDDIMFIIQATDLVSNKEVNGTDPSPSYSVDRYTDRQADSRQRDKKADR